MSITDSRIRLFDSPPSIRPAAVAGAFYPAKADELRDVITNMFNAVEVDINTPKALIVPHAGYIYSGPTAAAAYAGLRSIKQRIRRVILLGPAHRVYVKGMALPTATAFTTPLGNISIDRQAVKQIKRLPQVCLFDDAHAQEHSLEVQLPFLQMSLDHFSLVPIVVGEATPEQVAEALDLLWGGDETLIVISSDLSHFHDYTTAIRIDAATAAAIENLSYKDIDPEQACGCRPVNGLLLAARQRRLQVSRHGLCNSGDTAGSRDRVVGYGAWSLHEKQMLDEKQRQQLINIARQSIEQGFNTGQALELDTSKFSGELCETRASFVTLKMDHQLRGCIGTTEAIHPLVESVANNAFNAAFRDPRFRSLDKEEYKNTDISISVLTPHEAIIFSTETELLKQLRPGKDGLIIKAGPQKATFLPSVWESIPDANEFLRQLKLKAGMKMDDPPDRAWRYGAESFS